MFVCRACLRRGAAALTENANVVERRLASPLRTTSAGHHGLAGRAFATATRTRTTTATTKPAPPTWQRAPQRAPRPVMPSAAAAEIDHNAPPENQARLRKLEWVVDKHLQYLKDPLLIGEHVKRALEKGNLDETLMLVRKASRNTNVVVSWNHLIDYQLHHQRLHAAVKLYNEMKKRAQVPDARTYTIIFRGCAESEHPRLAVSESLRIYNHMISNGPIKPNTIHLNAVLDVCARAGDVESLFTVAKTATERGIRSPDNQTYTIILNALRHQSTSSQESSLEEEVAKKNTADAIRRARAIWEEVVTRWQNGQVTVDEELVCAMGRVLTNGDREDSESVLALVEQTMNIPRFDKKASLPAPLAAAATQPQITSSSSSSSSSTTTTTQPQPAPVPFKTPPTRTPAKQEPNVLQPKPGRNTLSLILLALEKTKRSACGHHYWDHLTKTHGVAPDKDNYLRYLRLAHAGRASQRAADIVTAMPVAFVSNMTFRVAFSTCIADELNAHAFANACRVFDAMTTKLRYPDPLAMRLFLQSARGNFRHFQQQQHESDDAQKQHASTLALGAQIVAALDRMWSPFRILMGSFSYTDEKTVSPQQMWKLATQERQEALATAKRMIAAMDTVVVNNMAEPEVLKIFKTRRTILQKMVERYAVKDEDMVKDMPTKVFGKAAGYARPPGGRPRAAPGREFAV